MCQFYNISRAFLDDLMKSKPKLWPLNYVNGILHFHTSQEGNVKTKYMCSYISNRTKCPMCTLYNFINVYVYVISS